MRAVYCIDNKCGILHHRRMKFGIVKNPAYVAWYKAQAPKFQAQIEKRLSNIELHGHFGNAKSLGDGVAELKFNNGVRIYFARTETNQITLLNGGNKNGQGKDIAKAKSLLDR